MTTPLSVVRTIDLEATEESVWEAVSTPEGLEGWLGSRVDLDVRPGGVGRVVLPTGEQSVLVTDVDPGRRLSLLWWDTEPGGDVSSVDFCVEGDADAGVTRLTVTERRAAGAAGSPGDRPGPVCSAMAGRLGASVAGPARAVTAGRRLLVRA